MSLLDNLVEAVLGLVPPPPLVATVGTLASATIDPTTSAATAITVSYHGSDPVAATWSSAFDLSLSTSGVALVGSQIMIIFLDHQPVVSDLIVAVPVAA